MTFTVSGTNYQTAKEIKGMNFRADFVT